MSENLLALASRANEAAIAYREAAEGDCPWLAVKDRGDELAAAVDDLTGAVVEQQNEAGIVVPLDDLTRLREIEDVAGHLGVTVPEAVVRLVNSALSGTFLDGYRSAIEELQEHLAEHEHTAEEWRRIEEHEAEEQRRIDAHEMYLASEGADHLFEGRGE